jgi:hypothetical protein
MLQGELVLDTLSPKEATGDILRSSTERKGNSNIGPVERLLDP